MYFNVLKRFLIRSNSRFAPAREDVGTSRRLSTLYYNTYDSKKSVLLGALYRVLVFHFILKFFKTSILACVSWMVAKKAPNVAELSITC